MGVARSVAAYFDEEDRLRVVGFVRLALRAHEGRAGVDQRFSSTTGWARIYVDGVLRGAAGASAVYLERLHLYGDWKGWVKDLEFERHMCHRPERPESVFAG